MASNVHDNSWATMSGRWFGLFLAFLGIVVLSGCSSVKTVSLTHVFPATGVSLDGSRRIQVIGFSGAPASSSQLAVVREVLGGIRGIQVVDTNPDYWLVTGWLSGFAQSTSEEQRYSSRLARSVSNSHTWGHEGLVTEPQVTTSCAMIATFSLVKASDLSPVRIFNVGLYDSDFSPRGGRALGHYEQAFRQSLSVKLREVLTPGNRGIVHQTMIPDNSPAELVGQLGRRGSFRNMPGFEGFVAGGCRPPDGDLDLTLTCYFLSFLNDELFCTDVAGLKILHRRYLQLLELSGEDSLVEATARGMARVEEKLRLLGHTPLT